MSPYMDAEPMEPIPPGHCEGGGTTFMDDGYADLTLRCPTCGQRADMCFDHGNDWKKRPMPPRYAQTDAQLRAGVNDFTQDDPPPYDGS